MTTEKNSNQDLLRAARQQQFLDVIDRDEAEARFRQYLNLSPLGEESIPLATALGRILSRSVISAVDVPGFDRSRMDGFALHASDTLGATAKELTGQRVTLLYEPGEKGNTAVELEAAP